MSGFTRHYIFDSLWFEIGLAVLYWVYRTCLEIRSSMNWFDFEQRRHHIVPVVHIEAVDSVGLIGLFDLTSKMSHGGRWRDFLRSRNRDSYRSWLHRVVRLTFLTEFHTLNNARGFLGNACSAWVSNASRACEV